MSNTKWAVQRRLMYIVGFLVVVTSIGVLLTVLLTRKPATCYDGKRNQDETGIDCGGVCHVYCREHTTPLTIKGVNFFKIRAGQYSALATVENKNPALIREMPYTFTFYDDGGAKLKEVSGVVFIAPRRQTPVFYGPINMNISPARVEFTLTDNEPTWLPYTKNENNWVSIEDKTLIGSDTKPRLWARIKNNHYDSLSGIPITTVIYDGERTPVAASQTVVDYIAPDQEKMFTYTWPNKFNIAPGVCTRPVDVMLLIDRSGSIDDDNAENIYKPNTSERPEPITTVLEAAENFVSELGENDRASLASFATHASTESGLTSDLQSVREKIKGLTIQVSDQTGSTNMAEGIDELIAEYRKNSREAEESSLEKIVVILTDGIANFGSKEEAEAAALEKIATLKEMGLTIYVIGLGNKLNEDFLRQIATSEVHYLNSSTKNKLNDIYQSIATSICSKDPSVLEIIPMVKEMYE